jgi:putative endonuclease
MSIQRKYWVYIMTNRWNTALYLGVTNNIARRVVQHKSGKGGMFTRKYNIGKLVYFEMTNDILSAIRREKQLKAGSREKKNALITSVNPDWRDLSDDGF